MEFKVGDTVYSIQSGIVTLMKPEDNCFEFYPLVVGPYSYTIDGKFGSEDLARSLFTLEEAEELGFPGATLPLSIKCRVNWKKKGSRGGGGNTGVLLFAIEQADFNWNDLVGKTGTLTFVEDPK